MIRKVTIKNFKNFEQQEFDDIPPHLVIAGPNNCGKTTLLQAIAAWSEIAHRWTETNPDLAREKDGTYLRTEFNLLRFNSVPLADFGHLWKDRSIQEPASVWLKTNRWNIGFEIFYDRQELITIRPAEKVHENDLKEYNENPLTTVYIPPLSGLDRQEPPYDFSHIPAQLARSQGGRVLRNMLAAVSQDGTKWKELQSVVQSFFGYQLATPSKGTLGVFASYRHSAQDSLYDLSSAASGFLQTLMIYTALLYGGASVLLVDEPDAHLHILLQEKIYRSLRDYATKTKSQLIIATHSEKLINAVDQESLRLLTKAGRMQKIPSNKLIQTMKIENTEIVLAETSPRILFVEGPTDVDILREWARLLNHRLLSFLEKPFWRATAEEKKHFAKNHFSALRLMVPDLRGIELRDGDGKLSEAVPSKKQNVPQGMQSLRWDRYEIESYLIHPEVLFRFVENDCGRGSADKARMYMKDNLTPALFQDPFHTSPLLQQTKGKDILSPILQQAGSNLKETEYYRIVQYMTKEDVHPEITDKLDAIADHFQIS